jgi:hypothetical protein
MTNFTIWSDGVGANNVMDVMTGNNVVYAMDRNNAM